MLAIVGGSGKIGGATVDGILGYTQIPADNLVLCTSSKPDSETWSKLSALGGKVRHASFDDPKSMETAFAGCTALYLVSTPRIELDYNDAPPGKGREGQHIAAIDAARSAGIKHIYYTSLAFSRPSKAGVMVAHIRTEQYLESLLDVHHTIIRIGLYNESWPLYLGYYKVPDDKRNQILVAGDGQVSWTAIPDLGIGSALILAAPSEEYVGRTLYLSTNTNVKTLAEVARLVGDVRGKPLELQVVTQEEHERHHTQDTGMPADTVRWWVTTYAALENGECLIKDSPLDDMLHSKGVTPKSMQDTVKEMLA